MNANQTDLEWVKNLNSYNLFDLITREKNTKKSISTIDDLETKE